MFWEAKLDLRELFPSYETFIIYCPLAKSPKAMTPLPEASVVTLFCVVLPFKSVMLILMGAPETGRELMSVSEI